MKTLSNIKKEYESILTMTLTGDYCQYKLLMDNDIHSDDCSEIFEYTLHRMIEEGFSQEEIRHNSGMYIPTDEQFQELEEFQEYTDIDLGYILGGLITSINHLS